MPSFLRQILILLWKDLLQEGKAEGGCFTSPCLSQGYQVGRRFQEQGDGFLLNRGGLLISEVVGRLLQLRQQAQVFK